MGTVRKAGSHFFFVPSLQWEGDFNHDHDHDHDYDDDHDLFVHRDTETQSFVLLKTFVSPCLYFPLVSDATALPQGVVFRKTSLLRGEGYGEGQALIGMELEGAPLYL